MQAWRSLVTPWVARHRRRSSWCLWEPHILLLYILYICSLSHCECNGMCNQLWLNHIIQLIYYNPLYSIIIFILLFFVIIIIICILAVKKWYTFSCDTALNSEMWFHSLHLILICLVLFHSFGVHTGLWYCIWNAAHKIFGGYVWPSDLWVVFGWPLGHLESPITPVYRLVLLWITHIYISTKLNL